MRHRHPSVSLLAALAFFAACSDGGTSNPTPDSPTGGGPDGGGMLRPFTAPADPGALGILVTVSGETLANSGYDFPPADPGNVYFVDGWEIRYDRVLVTFDHINLAENPDKSPADQSQIGTVVAQNDGPWAVDLHKGGSLPDKEDNPNAAAPITAFTGKNAGGQSGAFDATVRYAFSFEGVPAAANAFNVNLDADGVNDYQEMISKGYTALFVGTATFKGTSCVTTGTYDFTTLPTPVKFRLGFIAPAKYINAQNPDNDPAEPFAGEEHQRGVQVQANAKIISQVTFHLDHAFWESFVHDSPAHFDMFASQYVGVTSPTAKMEDFVGKPLTPVKDKNGVTLPWRFCPPAVNPGKTSGLTFDTLGIPVNATGDPSTSIRDLYDYTIYNHSTWGHLNADGLSAVKRQYPSPP